MSGAGLLTILRVGKLLFGTLETKNVVFTDMSLLYYLAKYETPYK